MRIYFLVISLLTYAFTESAKGNEDAKEKETMLTIQITPETQKLFRGQPLILNYSIKNIGKHPISFDLGSNAIEAFEFTLLESKNRKTKAIGARIKTAGFSRSGRRTLSAGEQTLERIVVNRWLSTDLPEGEYILISKVCVNDELTLNSENKLVVYEPREGEDRRYFEQIWTAMNRGTIAVAIELESVQILATANSPAVIPFLEKAVLDEKYGVYADKFINSLALKGTTEAVNSMLRILESDKIDSRFKDNIIRSIYLISDQTKDEKVKELCAPVLKKHKRPSPAPVTRD